MSFPARSAIRAILFDLDGTLCDTAPDLAFALNNLLREKDRPALAYEVIRPQVSHGGRALIQLGFQIAPEHPEFGPLRSRLLEIYHQNLARQTTLFPGIENLLRWIEAHDMRWGVVTNKPAWLTDPLMAQLSLHTRAACIVSGDTTANHKPHPEPMLYACRQTGCAADQCLYIGDAQRDIEAGRRAGMKTLAALYGYIADHETPHTWGADAMIAHPDEAIVWVEDHNQ